MYVHVCLGACAHLCLRIHFCVYFTLILMLFVVVVVVVFATRVDAIKAVFIKFSNTKRVQMIQAGKCSIRHRN